MQKRFKAEIYKIIKYTEDVRLFKLRPLSTPPSFKPGQFLHLAIDEYDPSYGWPDSRVFSIASSPNDVEKEIDIIVAKKGYFTRRMMEELTVGKIVWIKMPFGSFNFKKSMERNTILIAGGTGITPFIPFLKSLLKLKDDEINKIKLYYGVRDEKLIIIDELLKTLKSNLEKFDFKLFVENNCSLKTREFEKGILNIENIYRESLTIEYPIFYLSGPPVMINSFKNFLKNKRVKEEDILIDEWE